MSNAGILGKLTFDITNFHLVYGPDEPLPVSHSSPYSRMRRMYPNAYVWTCCGGAFTTASPCMKRDWHMTGT